MQIMRTGTTLVAASPLFPDILLLFIVLLPFFGAGNQPSE
jgi:hypothetical protein